MAPGPAMALLSAFTRPDGAKMPSQDQMPIVAALESAHRHWREGRPDEASRRVDAILEAHPGNPDARHLRGVLALAANDLEGAWRHLATALSARPDFDGWLNLAIVFHAHRRFLEARHAGQCAVAMRPGDPKALLQLGAIEQDGGDETGAEHHYRAAIAADPGLVAAHTNLGLALANQRRWAESEAAFLRAVELQPDNAAAWHHLSRIALTQRRQDDAFAYLDKALAIAPDDANAIATLAAMHLEIGDLSTAIPIFERAMAIDPGYWGAHDSYLFALNYDHRLSPADVYAAYAAYGAKAKAATPATFEHAGRAPAAGRRLRIGYSSPDFREHACRFFIEPILRHHDRGAFELFAYAHVRDADAHTERFKTLFDHWVDVLKMTDAEMAQRVRDDGIDVLIDLAGHSAGNRLLAFAMRPAPVAATYLGYAYTTGLAEIDHFIGDEDLAPPGSEPYFSENIWRLPAPSLTYEPPAGTPETSVLPALRNGFVTFGTLSRLVRLNEPMLRVWKTVLDRVPNARLRLDQKPFFEAKTRDVFAAKLENLGIARDRVDLTFTSPHWDAYRGIDIVLDCWPHNSGTTTVEALWMGVPVLTKLDRPSVGRVGAALLNAAGLPDWIAEDEAAFVRKAVAFAADIDGLAALRAGMRDRLQRSPLMDARGLTRKMEAAFRAMFDARR
jgi:protein O-GlcNAc transferase